MPLRAAANAVRARLREATATGGTVDRIQAATRTAIRTEPGTAIEHRSTAPPVARPPEIRLEPRSDPPITTEPPDPWFAPPTPLPERDPMFTIGPQGPISSPFRGFQQTSDPFGQVGGDLCRQWGIPDSICRLGEAAIDRWIGGSGGGEGSSSPGTQLVAGCPEGFRWNANTGQCETTGIRGGIERALPGGRTGTLADFQGEAVVGAFGIPGMQPTVVGQRMDARGEMRPILQCPTGLVLGKDNVCYVKGSIGRRFRKWPPRAKPPVSAGDAKAIRQADRAKNKVKKLAGKVGFSCRKR